MILDHKKINFEDDRGTITDIFTKSPKDHATVIFTKKGAVRGNHYHKESAQYAFIVTGKMMSYSQKPGEEVQNVLLEVNDLIGHEPGEAHAFVAEEDTIFLAFVEGLRGGDDFEKDTYRLEAPLVSPS